MHVTDKSATSRSLIHVLQHEDSRGRALENVTPQIASIMEIATADGGVPSSQTSGDGVSHHRRLVWKYAVRLAVGKSRIPQTNVERLDCVRNHAGIELAQRVEFRLCQQRPAIHAVFLSDAVLWRVRTESDAASRCFVTWKGQGDLESNPEERSCRGPAKLKRGSQLRLSLLLLIRL